jgi:hypothetical protein
MDDFQAQRQIAQAYADGVREGKEAIRREVRELAADCRMLCGVDQEDVFIQALLVMFDVASTDAMRAGFMKPKFPDMELSWDVGKNDIRSFDVEFKTIGTTFANFFGEETETPKLKIEI